ncbi:DUF1186 domain-containing protein [Reichenbachiella sp. MALMAid0571]|uniref:DUF1186 domain-containing protein n=1 Tax=Reichenbachiella sp. MALMAid0571 TaxID=3143939 RepID=UPI0032E00FFE
MSTEIRKYKVEDDALFFDKMNDVTPQLRVQFEKCYDWALTGGKVERKKIEKQIKAFPNSPTLKNYLAVWYSVNGQAEKSNEVNRRIVAEHPDYLFGKVNLGFEYFQKGQYEKIPEVMGQDMELASLYPNREVFHISEVSAFLKMTIRYFSVTGNMDKAESDFKLMSDLDPNSKITLETERYLMMVRMKNFTERMEKENAKKMKVKTKLEKIGSSVQVEPPTFHHSQINELYSNGLYIEEDTILEILSLPRETLVQDLHLVLKDSIDRYEYFNRMIEEDDWDDELMFFVIHAIFLLGELKSTESLTEVLHVLRQNNAYLRLYLGDFLTEFLWEPIYKIAEGQLDELASFACEPGIDTYAKSEISTVIEQVVYHSPDKKEEAVEWFRKVLTFYTQSDIEDNVIDSDLIGLMICNVIHVEAEELLPEMEMLFKLGYVSTGICGNYDEIERDIKMPSKYSHKMEVLGIVDRYDQITSTWSGYNPIEDYAESDYAESDHDSYPKSFPVVNEPKIGRNDPCPCGSGKKYKKCCL